MHPHQHKHSNSAKSGSTAATATSGDKGHKVWSVSAEDIRVRAYRKWESAGKPAGDGLQFWLEAEQELAHGK
jgi:Protein of unknown function (DUF2934)